MLPALSQTVLRLQAEESERERAAHSAGQRGRRVGRRRTPVCWPWALDLLAPRAASRARLDCHAGATRAFHRGSSTAWVSTHRTSTAPSALVSRRAADRRRADRTGWPWRTRRSSESRLYCLGAMGESIRRPRLFAAREDGNLWLWIHAAAFGMTRAADAGRRPRPHALSGDRYPLPFVWLAWLLLTHGSTRLYRTDAGAAAGHHDHLDAAGASRRRRSPTAPTVPATARRALAVTLR
jgi:hypothetical protein